jgi:uncharacterized protein (DUF2147 family)
MFAVIAALAATAQAPDRLPKAASIEGLWANPTTSVIIAIAPCDDALCGTVKWASAKARRDAKKGIHELIGANLLTRVRTTRDGRWAGKLFIPDRNMRVTAKILLAPDGRLKVSGCALGKSLCKSEYWTRAAEPLPFVNGTS